MKCKSASNNLSYNDENDHSILLHPLLLNLLLHTFRPFRTFQILQQPSPDVVDPAVPKGSVTQISQQNFDLTIRTISCSAGGRIGRHELCLTHPWT